MVPEALLLKHFKYLDAATDFVDGATETPPDIRDANECEVGVWLEENPNEELGEIHARFHQAIEEAVRLKQSGNDTDAKTHMDEGYILLVQVEKLLLEL